MALPTASDNAFPSLLITEGTVPATPAAGKQRVYINSTSHRVKLVNSSGVESELPGAEIDYVAFTSPVTLNATSEATANTIVTGSAISYDGNSIVLIEFYCPYITLTTNDNTILTLYDGSSSIGLIAHMTNPATTNTDRQVVRCARRLTPSNASHTYSIRGYVGTGSSSAGAGAGGVGAEMPGFIRITKV